MSGVSKRTDTKEESFVNVQELLEVTTELTVKLNDPVIDVGT
jgi:predicted RNase H-like HicB family nuclease